MNRKFPSLQFHLFSSSITSFMALASCIVLLASLSSCENLSKGRYKFQSESMHWLQFRGPNASGIAPFDTDPPIHFGADTNVVWKTAVLPGWSSPCIVNDRIFLTGFNQSDSMLHTFAIDREKGNILWDDSVKLVVLPRLHPINSYANPTVTSNGHRIFSHFPSYGLLAYELDGTRAWEFRHPPTMGEMSGGCSPVARDSIVIFNVIMGPNPRIQALDCESGDSLWVMQDFRKGFWTNATPVFWKDQLIMHQASEIVGYNTDTKRVDWWISVPTGAGSTPVIYSDIICVNAWANFGERGQRPFTYEFDKLLSHFDRNNNLLLEQQEIPDSVMFFQRPEIPDEPRSLMRMNSDRFFDYFDSSGDKAFDCEEWESVMKIVKSSLEDHGMLAFRLNHSGAISPDDLLWKMTDDTPETPSPLVVGENVFYIKNGGIMTAIHVKTGEVVKKGRIGAAGAYLSSPILAGKRIYTCSFNGTVSVLSADDFSALAHNKLKEKIGASPVAVDDVLYIRTDKHLYAFCDQ